jgi:Histidine kinase
MKTMSELQFRLDQPLPSDVVVRSAGGLMSYRNFPVFSLPWLRRRSLLFAVIFGCFFLLILFGMLLSTRDALLSVTMGGLTFSAFMMMACAGPAFATWVRHRGWPPRRERVGVVAGLLLGILLSYGVDATISHRIEQEVIDPRMKAAGMVTDEILAQKQKQRTAPLIAVNLVFLIGIYALLGGGLALRAYFNERRRWLESERTRELAELRARQQSSELRMGVLQAQIEPHFLFNTLASLRALVRTDPERAEATIDAFVDHLRATIPKLREDHGSLHSTLAQQFEICRSYLALMRVRIGERLSYTVDLPAALRDVSFPPLMLISLVENAIKHGVEPKPGPCAVRLSAVTVDSGAGSQLRVEVADSGAGLAAPPGAGIGLTNIREQLRSLYRERAHLQIQSLPGGGTLASISIAEQPS